MDGSLVDFLLTMRFVNVQTHLRFAFLNLQWAICGSESWIAVVNMVVEYTHHEY